jgi:hypothetical protein
MSREYTGAGKSADGNPHGDVRLNHEKSAEAVVVRNASREIIGVAGSEGLNNGGLKK